MNKLERLMKLLTALLDTTQPLTAEDLRRRIGGYPDNDASFRRAFERDKDDLRQMGVSIAVSAVPGTEPPIDGYRVDQEEYSGRDPGLTAEELAALHLAAALVRVESLGDDTLWKLGGRPDAGLSAAGGASVQVASGGETDVAGTMQEAIADRRTVNFLYGGRERVLEPGRLSFVGGRWYVSGFDRSREAERVFRLDRISSDIGLGEPAGFEATPARGPQVTRTWELGDEEPIDGVVQIEPPVVSWARMQLDADEIEEQSDGSIIATVEVRNTPMFRDWVLGFHDNAVVLGPPVLRQMMIDWLRETASA